MKILGQRVKLSSPSWEEEKGREGRDGCLSRARNSNDWSPYRILMNPLRSSFALFLLTVEHFPTSEDIKSSIEAKMSRFARRQGKAATLFTLLAPPPSLRIDPSNRHVHSRPPSRPPRPQREGASGRVPVRCFSSRSTSLQDPAQLERSLLRVSSPPPPPPSFPFHPSFADSVSHSADTSFL